MRNRVIQALQKKDVSVSVVLDVGANVGQSVSEFRAAFPATVIHAFEPIAATYAQLAMSTADDPLTTAHQLALSRGTGRLNMTSRGLSTGNKVVIGGAEGSDIETVDGSTGDAFCQRCGIARVDFLKVDAEGHDLDVVIGFRNMLADGAIRFVQVECGLAPTNRVHVAYDQIASVMFGFGYGLFGLFGLTPLRGSINLSANYGDAVFVKDGYV